MDTQVELTITQHKLQIHSTRGVLGGTVISILDMDDCLTGIGILLHQTLDVLPLIEVELVVDTPAISGIVVDTIIRDVNPLLGKPGNVGDPVGTSQIPSQLTDSIPHGHVTDLAGNDVTSGILNTEHCVTDFTNNGTITGTIAESLFCLHSKSLKSLAPSLIHRTTFKNCYHISVPPQYLYCM